MPWKNPWYDPEQPHHRPGGFSNLHSLPRQPGDVKRWREERKARGLPHPPEGGYPAFIERWWQKASITGNDERIWWLGHASLLLRLQGLYLLTDPVFSRRASPLPFIGPVRKTPVPLNLSELPQLDAVLISHNHYDHLDNATVRQISRRFPDVHYFVPLGLKSWFTKRGIRRVTELDWWQSFSWKGIAVTAVPAQHWSMRSPWDRNRSLWCGWVIESPRLRFWFSGDTGYSEDLLEIPRRLGPLDAVAIPIGAYAPRWLMASHHMDPQQAVRLWQQMGRPKTLPIHWGVFELADEALDEPPEELLSALSAAGEKGQGFIPTGIGQSLPLYKNNE